MDAKSPRANLEMDEFLPNVFLETWWGYSSVIMFQMTSDIFLTISDSLLSTCRISQFNLRGRCTCTDMENAWECRCLQQKAILIWHADSCGWWQTLKNNVLFSIACRSNQMHAPPLIVWADSKCLVWTNLESVLKIVVFDHGVCWGRSEISRFSPRHSSLLLRKTSQK